MSEIEFRSTHVSRLMNPGPSPPNTLDSYGTYSNRLKRQMCRDAPWLPTPGRGPILTPTAEPGAGKIKCPNHKIRLCLRPFRMDGFLHWALNQLQRVLCFFVQLIHTLLLSFSIVKLFFMDFIT